MKIKHRLNLIVLVPLVLLAAFATITVVQDVRARSEAQRIIEYAAIAKNINSLIDSLQLERGSSTGFLASDGAEFQSEMASARSSVDKFHAQYAEAAKSLPATVSPQIEKISLAFDELISFRQQISRRATAPSDIRDYYSQQIASLIAVIDKLVGHSDDSAALEIAVGYLSMTRAKEVAGQERMVGAAGFAAGAFTPAQTERFVELGARQEVYFEEMLTYVSGESQQAIERFLTSDINIQLSKYRSDASRIAFGETVPVSATEWFETASVRIDQMKELESMLWSALYNAMEARKNALTTHLLFTALGSLFVILVTSTLAFLQTRRIAAPLTQVSQDLEKIANRDLEFDVNGQDRSDEIGDISRALGNVRTNLAEARETEIENYYKGAAFAVSNQPMVVVDTDFRATFVNDASRNLIKENLRLFQSEEPNFDPENMVGEKFSLIENQLSDSRALFGNSAALPITREVAFGDHRVSIEVSGVFDSAGNHFGNVVNWADVTSERTNSGKLQAIDKTQAAIEFTLDGTIVDANENFLNAMGYTLEEVVGQHHRIFVEPEYANSPEYKKFWQDIRSGQSQSGEFKRFGKSGNEVWILANYTAIVDAEGVPFKAVKYAADITEEKIRNAKANITIKTIRNSQCVVQFECDGTVVDTNDLFLNAVGYSEQDVLGQKESMFVPNRAESTQEHSGIWEKLRKGETFSGLCERVDRDGNPVWLQAIYSAILDPDGKPLSVIMIASDVTESVVERQQQDVKEQQRSQELATVISTLSVGLNRLSDGDLTARLDVDFAEQYEQLKVDFNQAIDQLHSLIQSVASSASGLTSNSSEISQAADDLSRRTEGQAATLEETAAALDELTASVKSASEGAKKARDVVVEARQSAEASGEVVQSAVSAMDEIENSSRQISQIIGVIDDIAFQTNLLALNAGVEAARAGEAGRGFAVVASEVRALAQRSSDAAKEIKGLISASSQHVSNGVALVDQTGEALKRIVSSVADISDLVSEIANSSNEQSLGISEINTAVNQMDQGTQQNAAMVEETTAASHSMRQETQELVRIVSHFKTDNADSATTDWGSEKVEVAPRHKQTGENSVSFGTHGSAAVQSEYAEEDGWQDF